MSFNVFIDGNHVAIAAYDSQLAESLISYSFCSINHISHRSGVCNTAVTVEINTGELFTCAIKLKVSDSLRVYQDHPYDVILGHDWFIFCSTGLGSNPNAGVRLPISNQQLFSAASPINAIIHNTQFLSSKFIFDGCLSQCLIFV
jgi:hypothetical protein